MLSVSMTEHFIFLVFFFPPRKNIGICCPLNEDTKLFSYGFMLCLGRSLEEDHYKNKKASNMTEVGKDLSKSQALVHVKLQWVLESLSCVLDTQASLNM